MGKILIFYYNHNDIINELKAIKRIVHVFITTLRICLLKYENNNELLSEKNINLIELISLFHYSCLFVDNEQIKDIINKDVLHSYIRLHNIIYDDMVKYRNNNFIYINNIINDFHVEYFKNIIMNSKRFQSLLLLTCNDKYNMNINEDCLIKHLNIIRNELNVYDVKLFVFDGYLFEKQIFGTIKYNFWYVDSCCQLIFDKNTWLSTTNSCLFTSDILTKLEDITIKNRNFRRDITNIQFSGIEYVRNNNGKLEI
ncbi:unnamed protein product [Rotaria sp. Silwood2]|nr:unnamed protein product [Rotaria sp. Silwood2]CAF4441172.1 unnamed protein product [Rotaria sp. Silwood2]